MNQRIEKLIFCLRQCMQAYEQMITVLENEKIAALGCDVAEMNRCAVEKEKIVRQIRNYSEYREELILELSHSLNCQQTELTLSGLAEKAEPHQATQLKSVSDSLHVVLSRVRQANDENQWFINHILKVITNGLSIFDPLRTSFAVYGSTGSIGGQTNNYGMILSNCV